MLLKKIFAAKGVCSQICRFAELQQSFRYIISRVDLANSKSVATYFFSDIDDTACHTFKIDNVRYFGISTHTDEQWIDSLHMSSTAQSFHRLV